MNQGHSENSHHSGGGQRNDPQAFPETMQYQPVTPPPQYPMMPAPAPKKQSNLGWIVAGVAVVSCFAILVTVVIASAVFIKSNQRVDASPERTVTNTERNRPAPLPAPPSDRTVRQSSITTAQQREIQRSIQHSFPPAVGRELIMESCTEVEFLLEPTFRQLECSFPSPIRSGKVEYAGIVTDPDALNVLLNDYEFDDFRHIRSAPNHDFHLIAEVYGEEFGYATYAYDLHGPDLATTYIVFADEETASDFFVDVGLAEPKFERTS